jgi:hypothetical protein
MHVATAAPSGATNQIKALLTFAPNCSYNLICEISYRKFACYF